MEPVLVDQTKVVELQNQIRACLQQKRYAKADRYCQTITRQFPRHAEGWHLASHVALKLNQPQRALRYVETARVLSPEHHVYALHEIQCLMNLGEVEKFRQKTLAMQNTVFSHARLYHSLGTFYTHLKLYAEALSCYEKALGMQPDNLSYLYNKASLQRFLGDLDGAEKSCDFILQHRSDDGEVILMRSGLRKQSIEQNHVAALEQQLKTGKLDWRGQMQVGYALAKEHEDLQQYSQSFAALRNAADCRRRHMEYDVRLDVEVMEHIAQVFTPELFRERRSACHDNRPIFIVGLPRSGTTLLERMLASHSQIVSAGELNDFPVQLVSMCQEKLRGRVVNRTELVDISATIDFAELGQRYLRHVQGFIENAPCFIDKLPLNFLYTGLIHLAVPDAMILHMKRHPVDSCYSMYKQLFKDAYPFSYDLNDLAEYYLAYHRLMQHWRTLMPDVIVDVEYEALVSNPEKILTEVLARADLPMQASCLSFHQLDSASTTASAVQVRQPLYRSSVAKCKHVEVQLESLIKRLSAGGINCAI